MHIIYVYVSSPIMTKSLLESQAVIFLSLSPELRSVPWDITRRLDTPFMWAGKEKLL